MCACVRARVCVRVCERGLGLKLHEYVLMRACLSSKRAIKRTLLEPRSEWLRPKQFSLFAHHPPPSMNIIHLLGSVVCPVVVLVRM